MVAKEWFFADAATFVDRGLSGPVNFVSLSLIFVDSLRKLMYGSSKEIAF